MSDEIDPLDTEAQEQTQRNRAESAKRTLHIHHDDTRRLMSTKWGRRIVWRLLEQSGVFRLSFDTNAISMAFNEGNRNLGNQLLAEITSLCPERYLEMLKEQKQHVRTDNRSADDGSA